MSPMALVLWMLHIVASSGSMLETMLETVVRVLDVLNQGDSTRPLAYCGHPWQELDGGLLNGVFEHYKAQKTHTHTYAQGGLTCCMKMWLVKL